MTRTLFSGGSLFDPASGSVGAADVVIEDGLVVDVGSGLDGDTQIDATGQTILPGMFDCHVHMTMSDFDIPRMMDLPFSMQFFEAVRNLRTVLDLGITTVRDAWGSDQGVKQAVRTGLVAGPRLLITIRMISQTGGHADGYERCGAMNPIFPAYPGSPDGTVDGIEEVRLRVRELIRAGADGIKVAASGGVLSPNTDSNLPQLRLDELTELVAEANHAGRWVMAHCHSAAGARNAIDAGVRSIEHGSFLDDEVLALMADRGTWLVPTLLAAHGVSRARGGRHVDAGPGGREGAAGGGRGQGDRGPCPRRRRSDRHGHRLPGQPARDQPRGAAADGRGRAVTRAGAACRDAQRREAAPARSRPRQPRARQACRSRAGLGRPLRLRPITRKRVEQVWQDGVRVGPG